MNEERPTYANVVRKSMQPQIQSNVPFLGLTTPVHQDFNRQVHHIPQPSHGQPNLSQETFLDIQNKQRQMMELFLSLNQKMANICNMQM